MHSSRFIYMSNLFILSAIGMCAGALPGMASGETVREEAVPRKMSISKEGQSGEESRLLASYIAKPEPDYGWRRVAQRDEAGFHVEVLELTSQSWQNREHVNRSVWKHWLTIVEPEDCRHETAILVISGGANGEDFPQRVDPRVLQIASETKAIVVELGQVPNQPLVFDGDGKDRYEDDLIGYAVARWLETGDPEWIVRFPMVKSGVMAMNAVQESLAARQERPHTIDDFIVMGASKRGWTTWLVGAVDERVKGIVPIVIDCLNVKESMLHHYKAYGFWAPAVGDYVNHKVLKVDKVNSPEFERVVSIEDPYSYRNKLTMPKLVVNATGDEYFLPDSSQFYFDELLGEKHLCYVPNADHSLSGSNALESIVVFCQGVLTDTPRPKYDWKVNADGAIVVKAESPVERVRMWTCNNPTARDFRVETLGENMWRASHWNPTREVSLSPHPRAWSVVGPRTSWK